MMIKINYKIEGMDKLAKAFKKLGDVPQKHVTSSVKKTMNIPLKEARKNAPKKTGNLKKGIILTGEKSQLKGKKVYRVVFDRNMNDIFQKQGKTYLSSANSDREQRKRVANTKNKVTGYYPVSQEYGYYTKNGKYIKGKKFVHNAMEKNTVEIERAIIQTMQKKIDKELAKGGLRK